ncbi:MAG: hypothetical protein ACO3UM_06945 [Planctomycetota bacterium]
MLFATMSPSRLLASCAVLAALTGCNLWPERLGKIDLPAADAATSPLQPFALESATRTPATRLEDDLERVRQLRAEDEGTMPRVVREAQGGLLAMSIAEVRRRALSDSLDLDVALFDPEVARARVSAEEGRFDALIGARLRYVSRDTPALDGPITSFRSTDPQLDGQTVKFTEVPQTTERTDLGLGVTVPLPTGGRVALESVLDQKEIVEPDRYEQYLAGARFSFSQPLLRNAGSDAAQASIRLARADQRISEVRTRLAALRVLPKTGRTHQIRVHMSALRHPCCGDLTYGADPKLAAKLDLDRQWLHSVKLGFTHPGTYEYVEFSSDYAPELQKALDLARAL